MWSAVMAPSEHQRILKVWILLFFVLHQVYCLLPAPQNVTIVSFNLEHKLIWSPGPGTPIFTHFRVQSYRKKKKQWVSLLNCSELSTGESCDLTTYFNNPHCYYFARVQAFIPDQESNWTSSKLFYPILDTILGPPVVECTSCGNCLLLQLSPPPSRGHHRQLEFFFSSYIVNVSRTRDKAQFVIRASSGKNLINYLEPGVEYCITVLPETNMNKAVVPSGPHCAYTSPVPVNTVPLFVAALCTLFLLVALFSAALIYRGQLGVLDKLQPRILALSVYRVLRFSTGFDVSWTPEHHQHQNENV